LIVEVAVSSPSTTPSATLPRTLVESAWIVTLASTGVLTSVPVTLEGTQRGTAADPFSAPVEMTSPVPAVTLLARYAWPGLVFVPLIVSVSACWEKSLTMTSSRVPWVSVSVSVSLGQSVFLAVVTTTSVAMLAVVLAAGHKTSRRTAPDGKLGCPSSRTPSLGEATGGGAVMIVNSSRGSASRLINLGWTWRGERSTNTRSSAGELEIGQRTARLRTRWPLR
jgi:hypothetical protein